MLGEAATAAAKTNTFLGERYRRIVKRRGKLKALVAVARSILVVVWHLLIDANARFHDLGADYHTRYIDTERKLRSHLAQLAALGYRVTVTPAPNPNPYLHNLIRLRKLRRMLCLPLTFSIFRSEAKGCSARRLGEQCPRLRPDFVHRLRPSEGA